LLSLYANLFVNTTILDTNPLFPGTHTTGGTWARIISECLKDQGIDPVAVFSRAAIDHDTAIQPDHRIPDSKLRHLYPLCAEVTGIDCFGIHLGHYVKAHTFHALGLAILASRTVADALQRFARYNAIISDSGRVEIVDTGDYWIFQGTLYCDSDNTRLIPYPAIDAFFFGVVNMMREITDDPEFAPLKIERNRPLPVDPAAFLEAFKCPCQYECEADKMFFRREDIERPVRYANEALARQHDAIIEAFITQMAPEFEERIYHEILNALPNGEISADKLAEKLNMSLRKLQGKLQQQNTSYQYLLDKARRELACKYLSTTHYSLTDISFLLGYANSTGFSRAFKRWFKMSPSEYRQQRTANPK
jgi:AraC-like DNA-binding protein